MPANSNGIINDLGIALSNAVPLNKAIATATVSSVGLLTGLQDGSGLLQVVFISQVQLQMAFLAIDVNKYFCLSVNRTNMYRFGLEEAH